MAVNTVTGKKERRCYRPPEDCTEPEWVTLMRTFLAFAFAAICGGALGIMLGLGAAVAF
jgi:ABC-type nitrate/sulfonate/bicarbonate transport system permease component